MEFDLNGIDDILAHLCQEYTKGKLHEGNQREYVAWLMNELSRNNKNKNLIEEVQGLFKAVSEVEEKNDDSDDDEDKNKNCSNDIDVLTEV